MKLPEPRLTAYKSDNAAKATRSTFPIITTFLAQNDDASQVLFAIQVM